MPHDGPSDGVPNASTIAGGACKHGTVTLELCDANGKPIARASMGAQEFVALANVVFGDLEEHGFKIVSGAAIATLN